MPNANVTGTIAVKGLDGKYMNVTSTNGLEFGNQTLDNNSQVHRQTAKRWSSEPYWYVLTSQIRILS